MPHTGGAPNGCDPERCLDIEIVMTGTDRGWTVETVSHRRRNPFGMQPPCSSGTPVCGFGDPNADFHLIGDHPGIHGGRETGVPFTRSLAGERLQGLLADVELIDEPGDQPGGSEVFMSYLYACPVPSGCSPSPAEYADHDRFFDAELRAVNAHILLPVGRRATDRVLEAYTTRLRKEPRRMDARHATEIRGRGFLVVPIKEPICWAGDDPERLRRTLERILASDYRQTKGVATLVG